MPEETYSSTSFRNNGLEYNTSETTQEESLYM